MRNRPEVVAGWIVLSVGLMVPGCGSGRAGNEQLAAPSKEQVVRKKADLFAAMKGGAYGRAGRASAPRMNPAK